MEFFFPTILLLKLILIYFPGSSSFARPQNTNKFASLLMVINLKYFHEHKNQAFFNCFYIILYKQNNKNAYILKVLWGFRIRRIRFNQFFFSPII